MLASRAQPRHPRRGLLRAVPGPPALTPPPRRRLRLYLASPRHDDSRCTAFHPAPPGKAITPRRPPLYLAACRRADGTVVTYNHFGRRKTTIIEDHKVTLEETQLGAGGSLLVNIDADEYGELTGRDSAKVVLEGTRVDMGQDALVYGGDSVNVLSGIEYESHRYEKHKRGFGGLSRSGRVHSSEARRLGHAEINSGGDTVLLSGGDINVVAGHIKANNIVAEAGFGGGEEDGDAEREASINILGDKETYALFEHRYRRGLTFSIDDNFLSLAEETHKRDWQVDETYVGSMVQAMGDINLKANTDINIVGSQLEAGGNLLAQAGRDLSVLAGSSRRYTEHESETTRIGIGYESLGNGFEVFAGAETRRTGNIDEQQLAAGSFAGADTDADLAGSRLVGTNIMLQSEADITLVGADLATWMAVDPETGEPVINDGYGNIDIRAGRDLNTLAAVDEQRLAEYEERLRVGIKISAQENVSSAADAVRDAEGVSGTLRAIDAIQGARSGAVSASAGLVAEYDRSEQETTQTTVRPTSMQAAGDLHLESGRDQRHQGTQALAGRDIRLQAGDDLLIESAQQTYGQTSESQSTSVSLALGTEKGGISGNLGASDYKDDNIFQANAQFTAGRNTVLQSGGDATIAGAVIHSKTIDADIGGDLLLASRQDSGKIRGWSANVSASTSGFGVGGSYTRGDRAWVEEQSGLFAENDVDIQVGGHTELVGAAINSDSGQLTLSTETLAFSDIHDRDKYKDISANIGIQSPQADSAAGKQPSDPNAQDPRQAKVNSVDVQYQSHDRRQINRATIGNGSILVRADEASSQDSTAGLNRDIALAQQLTRDDRDDFDIYYSDQSFDTLYEGIKAPGKLVDLVRPDLIVAEVAGSAITGFGQIDDAFTDGFTLNGALGTADLNKNRGLLAEKDVEAVAGRVEDRILAASDILIHRNDAGQWEFLGLGEGNDISTHYARLQRARTDDARAHAALAAQRAREDQGARALRDGIEVLNNLTDFRLADGQRIADTYVETLLDGAADTLFYGDGVGIAAFAKGASAPAGGEADRPRPVAGLNIAATDVRDPRQVVTTLAEEAYHQGAGEDHYANLYGDRMGYLWERDNARQDRHTGGRYGVEVGAWRAAPEAAGLLYQNNQRVGAIPARELEFRQLVIPEIQGIERIADKYAQRNGLTPEQSRRELTQQALSMVDRASAEQPHITENPRARAALEALSQSSPPLSSFLQGKDWWGFKEYGMFTANEKDFNNPYLNSQDLWVVEQGGAEEFHYLPDYYRLKGYISRYGTAEGQAPIGEPQAGEVGGKILDDTKKGFDQFGQAVEARGFGLVGDVLGGMWDSLAAFGGDCADRGVKCLAPDFVTQGTAQHKAEVDRLQGNPEALLAHRADAALT